MKDGFYWAKYRGNPSWELVEVEKNINGINRVFFFGTEFTESVENFSDFVKIDLVDPDGNPYYNSGDNYEGN
jgi:hypothetical protein